MTASTIPDQAATDLEVNFNTTAQRSSSRGRLHACRRVYATLLCCVVFGFNTVAAQQSAVGDEKPTPTRASEGMPESPGKVEVQPVAKDDDIRQRLSDILNTTGWFVDPQVTVEDGIVYLKGATVSDESRQWARDLAKNTEGVVAVVNQIAVTPGTVWNFDPTIQVLNELARGFIKALAAQA